MDQPRREGREHETQPAVTNLRVLACLFNPTKSQRIAANYKTFRRMLGSAPVTVVELVLDDDPLIDPNAIHVRGTRERHAVWQKERLLNIGLESLPGDVDAVAWLDTDIVLPSTWYQESLETLQHYPVIQPFTRAYWLDKSWRTEQTFSSIAGVNLGTESTAFTHPGFAWVARREVLKHGLFDLDLSGNGDIWIASAFDDRNFVAGSHKAPRFVIDAWSEWRSVVTPIVDGRLGAIKGDLLHLHHGHYANRKYSQRGGWMLECGVTQDEVILDDNGLYAVPDNSYFTGKMREYFQARRDG